MKKTIIGILIVTIAFLSCSCEYIRSHPSNYQNEIEDYVRYNVSIVNYTIDNAFVVLFSTSRLKSFENEIARMVHNGNSYETALTLMAKDADCQYNKTAQNVLNEYKRTRVVLSDYELVPTSSQTMVWEFKELYTGILFYFSICGNDYMIEVDDDSMERYLLQNIGL